MRWIEFFKLQWGIFKTVSPYLSLAFISIPIFDAVMRKVSPKYQAWVKRTNETDNS